jgi:hypothetical protein
MAVAAVTFFCKQCPGVWHESHHYCPTCTSKPELHVSCPSGSWSGLYTNWRNRHWPECGKCNPALAQETGKKHESKAEARSNDLYASTSNGTVPYHVLIMRVTMTVPNICELVSDAQCVVRSDEFLAH